MEFYFLPFNFLLFFSFLSLDRQLVDFTYPSFLLFKFLKSKEWMEQWKWYNQISTSKSNVLEKRKKHKQRSFVLLDSLPYSDFSARNQRFHTFTKKFFTSFFFSNRWTGRPVKVGTIFRRASRLTGWPYIHWRGAGHDKI